MFSYFSVATLLFLSGFLAHANGLPAQPTDPQHPGSAAYSHEVEKSSFRHEGRQVDLYLPKGKHLAPIVVFGHGQAIPAKGYQSTFEHLARKGVAVIFPEFDNGFFDQNWRRMARDFNSLTAEAIRRYPNALDADNILYAGHSKGAYIALMAAGDAERPARLGGLLLFAAAGYDADYLARLDTAMPVTVIWGEADSVIKRSTQAEIYNRLPSHHKQLIEVKNYPGLSADHFFPLSDSFFFGGRKGISPFHYFGSWKWLLGAVWDMQADRQIRNTYLYGEEATTTGSPEIEHMVTRSW